LGLAPGGLANSRRRRKVNFVMSPDSYEGQPQRTHLLKVFTAMDKSSPLHKVTGLRNKTNPEGAISFSKQQTWSRTN
jgi:hypothetical protein